MMSLVPWVAAQEYTVSNLPTLGLRTIPNAINSNGDVVGYFYLDKRAHHAFLWTKSGGMQDLGTLGGEFSVAAGINDRGEIAGYAETETQMAAFVWTRSSGMRNLGTQSGGYTFAMAINQQGDVVGGSDNAVLWPDGGGIVDLGVSGWGAAINSLVQIAGSTINYYAFLWTQEQGIQYLGTLGGWSQAWVINDSGQVAGRSEIGNNFYHAFLWTQGTGMQDLGTLGGNLGQARGINAKGTIVGDDNGTAFIWTATLGMKDLNSFIAAKPSWRLGWASAINDGGQIAVAAFRGTSKRVGAVLLTPIMATTLVSSQNPVKAGQPVTFTAMAGNLIQGPPPDGEIVTFKDGSRVLAQIPLSNGAASFTTSGLTARTHKIRAYYSGDVTYQSSKSAILQQVVQP